MKQKIIGLTGFARSGKDSFYKIASEILKEEYNLKSMRYALADALKADTKNFIYDKVGLDVYTDNPDEKSIFRPLLVAYGKCKRVQSNGTYWTSLLQNKIELDTESDVVFVTDIRYAEYEQDEVQWIKNVMGGDLIHITKYEEDGFGGKLYIKPPNDDEAKNDPVIRSHADALFQWRHSLDAGGVMDTEYMKSVVRPLLQKIMN